MIDSYRRTADGCCCITSIGACPTRTCLRKSHRPGEKRWSFRPTALGGDLLGITPNDQLLLGSAQWGKDPGFVPGDPPITRYTLYRMDLRSRPAQLRSLSIDLPQCADSVEARLSPDGKQIAWSVLLMDWQPNRTWLERLFPHLRKAQIRPTGSAEQEYTMSWYVSAVDGRAMRPIGQLNKMLYNGTVWGWMLDGKRLYFEYNDTKRPYIQYNKVCYTTPID